MCPPAEFPMWVPGLGFLPSPMHLLVISPDSCSLSGGVHSWLLEGSHLFLMSPIHPSQEKLSGSALPLMLPSSLLTSRFHLDHVSLSTADILYSLPLNYTWAYCELLKRQNQLSFIFLPTPSLPAHRNKKAIQIKWM